MDESTQLLSRPRLHRKLSNETARLIVMAAPTGYGKSAVVRDWASRLNPQQTQLIDLSGQPDPAAILSNERISGWGPGVVVLDGFDSLGAEASRVEAAVGAQLLAVPTLRVVLVGRTTHGLSSPGWVLRDQVTHLGASDLLFTGKETERLLTGSAPMLGASERDRLHSATGGLPLALRAVLVAYHRSGAPERVNDADWQDLVAADVAAQVGAHLGGPAGAGLVNFMLDTSQAPAFDETLVTELGLEAPVAEYLATLSAMGLGQWCSDQQGRTVFAYPEPLRQVQLGAAQRRPREIVEHVARATALWLHARGEHDQAFVVAVGNGVFDVAARIYALLVGSDQSAVAYNLFDKHLAQVPSRALTQFPALAFGRGLACHRNPALRGAAAEFFEISARWTGPRFANLSDGEVVLGHVSKTVSLRLLGRIEESRDAALAGVAFIDSLADRAGEIEPGIRPMAFRHFGYSLFQAGDLAGARTATTRSFTTAETAQERNFGLVHAVGMNAFEGRVVEARAAQLSVDQQAWQPGHLHAYPNAWGRIGESVLRLDAFEPERALAEYEGCELFRDTSEFWPFITWTLMHARLGLGQAAAEARRVDGLLRRLPPPPGMSESLGAAAVRGALAVLWLAADRRPQAMELLEQPGPYGGQLAPAILLAQVLGGQSSQALARVPELEALGGHTERSLAALFTVGAVAAVRTAEESGPGESAGFALLGRAVALVGTRGARAHLMYLPPEDLQTLRQLAQGVDVGGEVVEYLSGQVPSGFFSDTTYEALTAQERVVAAAYAQHVSRGAVASALHVSENTVKTHLQRIYRKLGVNSRAGIIERAVELDLLSGP